MRYNRSKGIDHPVLHFDGIVQSEVQTERRANNNIIIRIEMDFDAPLSSYVQEIQNKISIAVAIAVIKSKPEDISTREYIGELQRKVLKDWQKETTPGVFENRMVSLQQNKVAQDVAEVLPDSPTVEDEDSTSIPGCSTFLVEGFGHPLPFPDDAAVEKQGHVFKSLVWLKFATETRKTVRFKWVQEFIEEAKDSTGSAKLSLNGCKTLSSPKKSQVSEDSGVATNAGYPTTGPDSVSTSLFKSITHSSDTEALITKTARSLLNYVEFTVYHCPFEGDQKWKGSLLEKTCSILAGALTDAHCRAAVTAFLETTLDRIWTTDDVAKSFAIEHQLLILTTLCQVSDVCTSALNNVMLKCEEFVATFSNGAPPLPSSVHKIEKMPHFSYFAELLLSRWMQKASERLQNSSEGPNISPQVSASKDYWRLRTNEGDRSLDKSELLISSWCETLQKLSVSSVETYPLINLRLLRTLFALNVHETSSSFQTDENHFFETPEFWEWN